jgi:hypothetical protein
MNSFNLISVILFISCCSTIIRLEALPLKASNELNHVDHMPDLFETDIAGVKINKVNLLKM